MNGRYAWIWLVPGLVAPAVSPANTTTPAPLSFDRYGIIIERKPFGEETLPTPVVDPTKPILPPDQSFTAKFKMAAVTRNSKGVIQVGLVDLKTNRSYMLEIGDAIEGVEVVEADYVTEKARLRRDPEDYWVSMSGGSNHFEIVRKDVSAPVASTTATSSVGGVTLRTGSHRSSYAARRQSREEIRIRQELEKMQAMEAKRLRESKTNEPAVTVASLRAGKSKGGKTELSATGQALIEMLGKSEDSEMSQEEVMALLQQYQKELIRGGQAPLPGIPLTPETDQELVDEGVLPPQQ